MASSLAHLLKRGRSLASDAAAPSRGKKRRATAHAVKEERLTSRRQAPNHDDVDAEDVVESGESAYDRLLGFIADSKGSAAAAIRQRRLEEAGQSDDSSSSDSDDDSEELETAHGHGIAVPEEQLQQRDVAAPDGSASSSSEQDGPPPGAASANGLSAGSHEAEDTAQGSGLGSQPAAAGADAGGNASSQWEQHVSHQLTDAEAASLKAGTAKWVPLTPAGSGQQRTQGKPSSSSQQERVNGQGHPAGTSSSVDGPYAAGWQGVTWEVSGRRGLPPAPARLAAAGVKDRVRSRWLELHRSSPDHLAPGTDFVSEQQQAMFGLADAYCDVLNTAKPYPEAPGVDPLVDVILLHCLNHCAKMADLIKRNNDRIKAAGADAAGDISQVPRDQGFVRAKVLLLLPMRNVAYAVVRRLVALAQKETRADSVQGKEKFVEQFAGDTDEEDFAAAATKRKGRPKPPDFRALFSGNTDDHFRMGIRITRGQVKLFADLVNSDIIVASPLALATKIAEDAAAAAHGGSGSGGDGQKGGKKGGRGGAPPKKGPASSSGSAAAAGAELDFLSSIEVVVVERADVMLMQNWQHVLTVFEHLNKLPSAAHGTDIMRVREAFLSGSAACYRQTLLSASFAAPQFNALLKARCCCWQGKVRLASRPAGVLGQVVPQVRQMFERFTPAEPTRLPEARFDFFRTALWPRLQEGASGGGLLLVVPDYLDFLRLRKFLTAESADFATLCEYTPQGAATRARALFAERRVRLLLYTERAHFYHRWSIRGVQDVVFYGVPLHGGYYAEIVNLMEGGRAGGGSGSAHGTVTAMFSAYDRLALARVVGASRADKMVTGESPTYMFC